MTKPLSPAQAARKILELRGLDPDRTLTAKQQEQSDTAYAEFKKMLRKADQQSDAEQRLQKLRQQKLKQAERRKEMMTEKARKRASNNQRTGHQIARRTNWRLNKYQRHRILDDIARERFEREKKESRPD